MLDGCAPGHTRRIGKHRLVVNWAGKSFLGLPKGPGGGAKVAATEVHRALINKLVRGLGLSQDCARRHFDWL